MRGKERKNGSRVAAFPAVVVVLIDFVRGAEAEPSFPNQCAFNSLRSACGPKLQSWNNSAEASGQGHGLQMPIFIPSNRLTVIGTAAIGFT